MKRLRGHALAATALLVASCGGSKPAIETPTVKTGGESYPTDSSKFEIADRSAPVPEATDEGERIIYLKGGAIWMMGPDGEEPTQLTVRALDAPNERAALSPGGDKIAYSAEEKGVRHIHVMSLEEMIPIEVTTGEGGGDSDPSWSPDGHRLLFMRGDPLTNRDLYIVDAVKNATPRLILKGDDDTPASAGTPVFTPDGEWIVMSGDRRQQNGTLLWKVDPSNGALTQLTPTKPKADYVADRHPAVSPDGKIVAFSSNRHVGSSDDEADFDIYVIGIDGSGLTRLTSDPGIADFPTYSPSGQRLYFASTRQRERDYEVEIYVMSSHGGQQRRLTRDAQPQNTAPFSGRVEDTPE